MLDDAMPLWLTLVEPPESCYPVLEALILEKRVLADGVGSVSVVSSKRTSSPVAATR
jgi:hypothetical protein